MVKFIVKLVLYGCIIFALLEVLTRMFHLHNEMPDRFVDKKQVERMVPNQHGFSITGNRKQNVGEFRVNTFGFNSKYDSFELKSDSLKVGLIGDSFIQGFHQDYTNSLGVKIERNLPKYKVYEFGYAGWDMADQLHFIKAYDSIFKHIDKVIVYLNYTNDLYRGKYEVTNRLRRINTPIKRLGRQSKLILYSRNIGILEGFRKSAMGILNKFKSEIKPLDPKIYSDEAYLENFKSLVEENGYNKEKYILLLDHSTCSQEFLEYLNKNDYKSIDYGKAFKASNKPTNLIYDQHWNNLGRELIAKEVALYFHEEQ